MAFSRRLLVSSSTWSVLCIAFGVGVVACSGSAFQSAKDDSGGAGDAAGQGGSPAATSGGAGRNAGGASTSGGSRAIAGTGGATEPRAGSSGASAGAAPVDSGYRAAILADQPLVYWRMGIRSGLSVPDETGGGNDLVLQGTGHVLGADGSLQNDDDGAIGFDGVASFAIATDARALDFTGKAAFTLECWAKRSNGGASYFQYLMADLQGSAGNRNGYSLYLLPEPTTDSPRSVFEYDLPAADLGVFGPMPALDTWAHYAAVYDGTTASLYVNGTLANSSTAALGVLARTGVFAVGRSTDGGASFFKGALDELAIYPRALGVGVIVRHFGYGK